MPRFFFHLEEDVLYPDEEGQELPDEAAARHVALVSARELACADIMNGCLNLEFSIQVADAAGTKVATVSFIEAVGLTAADRKAHRRRNPG